MGNGPPVDPPSPADCLKGLATNLPITRCRVARFYGFCLKVHVNYYGGVFGWFCHFAVFSRKRQSELNPNAGGELPRAKSVLYSS